MADTQRTTPDAVDPERTDAALELASRYDPATVEGRWVRRWADEPFRADPTSGKPPFTIVIPPPNVTGDLHLGHAFDNTLIDTLVRFKRMQGFEALFQPGTDHAGIATQVLIERALAAEGTDRHAIGREAFVERAWAWKERYGGVILGQLQRLGVSADWSRTRFTMDEGLSRAVREQFVELYHRGVLYRGERIVQWDPASQTTLSDLEVDREDRPGKLYTLAYELEGGPIDARGAIEIATVRPETIFADQAVAVHPEDERYTAMIGARVRIPLTDRTVPVIADEAVEREFGTGALKITPAHDQTDFEIGERHGLGRPVVIDLHARLTSDLVPEAFRGMDRFAARDAVVHALEEDGSLRAVRDHTVALGLSQRTMEPVEPLLSMQWFYHPKDAAARSLRALDDGEIRLVPERYTKVNRDWLERMRPWNVSRQLWWGHRIPAWYDEEGNVVVPERDDPHRDPTDDPRHEGRSLRQDPDVFDTWFSSNLWPFSTLGWPDRDDPFFRTFYPTDVLVTGYDILFFWVAKMEMAAFEFTDVAPFSTVLLHGLVLDAEGRKMSKSRGNGIDPLEIIDQHGADALRFAMTHLSTGSQDIRWDDRRVEMGRNFVNKLWNAARFTRMQLAHDDGASTQGGPSERLADRWIASRLQRVTADATGHLEGLDLGMTARTLYDAVWSDFCDWYLEAAKVPLKAGDVRTRRTLRMALETLLRLLHPVIPFVTSELWEALGHEEQLALAPWPRADPALVDPDAERDFERLRAAVVAARQLRAEANLSPAQVMPIHVAGDDADLIVRERDAFESLARARLQDAAPIGAALVQPLPSVTLTLPFDGLVDVDEWRARQAKRLAEADAERTKSAKKLANDRFVTSAPEAVVAEERRRLAEGEALVAAMTSSLERVRRG
ncbi:MAG: valine--tRNA ligase [Trueperaceae bacterium]|nr:valine--tRNA ligase [Trueperaceae bacterium]